MWRPHPLRKGEAVLSSVTWRLRVVVVSNVACAGVVGGDVAAGGCQC